LTFHVRRNNFIDFWLVQLSQVFVMDFEKELRFVEAQADLSRVVSEVGNAANGRLGKERLHSLRHTPHSHRAEADEDGDPEETLDTKRGRPNKVENANDGGCRKFFEMFRDDLSIELHSFVSFFSKVVHCFANGPVGGEP